MRGRQPGGALVLMGFTLMAACTSGDRSTTNAASVTTFLTDANTTLTRLGNAASEAGWVQSTYITRDTQAISARATEAYVTAETGFAKQAARFAPTVGTPEEQRQLTVLRNTISLPAPPNAQDAAEMTRLAASLDGAYGSGKYCPQSQPAGQACLDVEAITEILAKERDEKRLREVWEGWHTISPPFKQDYARFVELMNLGARDLGFADTGALWRSRYDMPPDAFARELDRLWEQLTPLYQSLHSYVRTKLRAHYGAIVPANGPIPAHLLGNIWAQEWNNMFPLVAPPGMGQPVPLDDILRTRRPSALDMARYGERFFTSLGFDPLPATFWERSLFTKPADREVVCHASAWNVNSVDDLRIKMCIDPTAEDFMVIHHELGHNFYDRAYNTQPYLLRGGANDGFHEAIGDTIALSVTPEYLVKVGLLDKAPPPSGDIALLVGRGLEKVAFLPFGLLVDQWRWKVFSGEVGPDAYNKAWWDLRLRYQGVAPPSVRGEEFFDAGAKYHVPGNTPYARYFLSFVLEFQFHRALAKEAGCTTPLHRCSIYGSTAAGARLKRALAMGASKPWPDVLEALTGERQLDATAIAEYFAPLKTWLDEQNRGQPVGW